MTGMRSKCCSNGSQSKIVSYAPQMLNCKSTEHHVKNMVQGKDKKKKH